MANDNYARGLVPVNLGQGNLSAHYYRVSTAADIYLGQPVNLPAAGYVIGAGVATANAVVLGVALGFAGTLKRSIATPDPFLDVSDLTPPVPSSDTGDRFILVADDPNQEYYIQEDTGGTALALADVGASVDMLYRGADGSAVTGNVDTGWVTAELDASTIAATTAGMFTLLRLHDGIENDGTNTAVGDYAKWVVRITHHQKTGLQAVAQA